MGAIVVASFFLIVGLYRFSLTGKAVPAFFLSKAHKEYLNKNFSFYQLLPQKSKEIFSKKVARFMSSKRFIPRDIPAVTPEMKLLISASAIQLTFGFPRVNLSYFQNILVYPDAYYSPINGVHHRGEVNPRFKAIVLSWRYFLEGYLQKDGRNLGLHEMAHALRIENKVKNEEYNFLDPVILQEWELRAKHTMIEIAEGREDFFREYGATNNEEFFAVAVENYFERPILFREKHPLTYQTLCRLLRQDPASLQKMI